MKKTWTIIICVIVVAAVAGLGVWWFAGSHVTKKEVSEAVVGTTITYTNSGFSPASLRAKAGSTITIKNESSKDLQFDSDPHPVHTKNPELNTHRLAPGESLTITVDKVGDWGYHNHLDPLKTGTIIVE